MRLHLFELAALAQFSLPAAQSTASSLWRCRSWRKGWLLCLVQLMMLKRWTIYLVTSCLHCGCCGFKVKSSCPLPASSIACNVNSDSSDRESDSADTEQSVILERWRLLRRVGHGSRSPNGHGLLTLAYWTVSRWCRPGITNSEKARGISWFTKYSRYNHVLQLVAPVIPTSIMSSKFEYQLKVWLMLLTEDRSLILHLGSSPNFARPSIDESSHNCTGGHVDPSIPRSLSYCQGF